MTRSERLTKFLLILFFTVSGFVVMGYHPGLEDDGIYLTAVKSDLNPALYLHNSLFFRLQVQATLFDRWMAAFIRLTHMPVAWAELAWQLAALFATLWACQSIARKLFPEQSWGKPAQWAAVAMVSAMFTLPVSGTALYLMDQHLHPRNLATALILLAVDRILARQPMLAVPLLTLAFVLHPIMAVMGISFSFFLVAALSRRVSTAVRVRLRALRSKSAVATPVAAAVPLRWVFEPATPAWRQALDTRTYYYLYKWHWYEWLGALAPIALFWLLWRWARARGEVRLARFALAVFAYSVFQQVVAMAVLAPDRLVRLTPLQPMRYLQLVYYFMALIAGGLLGRYVLKARVWRWAALLLVANGAMLAAQCAEYNASQHLEWPGRSPANPWLQAFAWIRTNTPVDAYFALDPYYLEAPGEDYHAFRALAERSHLADAVKDAAAVTQVPELGDRWAAQVDAQEGWRSFRLEDFQRLKREFGVDWVLVALPQAPGLDCHWHNDALAVCEIP
jgi:hypothetical protein